MSDNKVYETKTVNFLTKQCRIIETEFEDCNKEENQWLILKDMFDCLFRLDENNNITGSDKTKFTRFMKKAGWETDSRSYTVCLGKDSLGRNNVQAVDCIRLNKVPMLIAHFTPTEKADENVHMIWQSYINFVNNILLQNNILSKLFIAEQSKEEALRQFQNKIFTLAQVASDFKCKNGKELKDILVQMNLVKMKNGNIDDYNAKFLNCTNKLIRVKAINIEELVNEVAQYKEANNIEDYVPKQLKSKPKKKLRCKQTGKEFTTKVQAAEYGNTGSTSINNYLKGLQAYAGKLEDGTRLTWEWVQVEEQ